MFEATVPSRDTNQFTESNIIIGVITFIWLEYFLELYLRLRQHFVFIREVKVPDELSDSLPQAFFDSSRSYHIEKSAFTIFKEFVVLLLKTSVVISRSHVKMWNVSGEVMHSFGYMSEGREVLRSCIAIGLSNAINSVTFTPFRMFETFVLDRRYGLSKPTLFGFLKDQLKTTVLTVAMIEPMVAGLVYIVQHDGPLFYLHLWAYTVVMVLIYLTIYPEFIAPFFETIIPLHEGELLSRIHNLCAEMELAAPKVYVIEGSRKEHFNQLTASIAFGRMRIDIDCNIIKGYKSADGRIEIRDKGLNNDMLVALVAHQLAQRKLYHLIKKSLIVQVILLMDFYIFYRIYQYNVIYSAFGFSNEQPIIMGFVITMDILLAPLHVVGNIGISALNRRYELEADQFTRAMGLGIFLRKAIIHLTKDNLIFPVYDPLYSKWFDKNPPLRERVNNLRRDS